MNPTGPDDPLRALGGTRRAYVIPELKVLYISVAKNACTTIKWLISELAGEDPGQFALGAGPFVFEYEGIHRRSRWQRTPTLNQLEPGLRAQISPDNGWFVFGVVRDPRARLFSAWQNKLLMRSPAYARWRDEPCYPRVPQRAEDIVEDFAVFVDFLHAGGPVPDAHFEPQVPYLAEDVVPYSSIYEISQLGTLVADLETHVRAQGWTGAVRLRQSNDTPLRARADVFAGPVRAQVEALFQQDLQRFGHLWDFERLESVPPWSADALSGLRAQIAMSERITDLLGHVRVARTAADTRRDQRIAMLEQQLVRARADRGPHTGPADPVWKRAARPVVRRLRSRRQR